MIRLLLIALATTGIVDLTDGWQYASTAPRNTPPGSEVTWHEEVEALPDRDLWYRIPLPASIAPDSRLAPRVPRVRGHLRGVRRPAADLHVRR
jgi:hypothetical protein